MSAEVRGERLGEAAKRVARALAHALVGGEPVACRRSPARPSLSVSETTPHGALHQLRILGDSVDLVDQHQLGRAAADVEDQRRAVAGLEQLVAAEHRQPRLFLRAR